MTADPDIDEYVRWSEQLELERSAKLTAELNEYRALSNNKTMCSNDEFQALLSEAETAAETAIAKTSNPQGGSQTSLCSVSEKVSSVERTLFDRIDVGRAGSISREVMKKYCLRRIMELNPAAVFDEAAFEKGF
mmetsp:Transcript_20758/g.28024  ORF Transcript_20758/g.28024 Transcript_20758/m.28024 type:complete len:134 (-) Transcript_20758:145-546(-)